MSSLTEQAIKSAFLKLLSERPFSRITVRDIAQECGINRNSFYYHYHDIPELMEEIIRDEADSLVSACSDISSLEECVETVFRFITKNRRSINHVYHSVNRETFEQHLMRICEYTVNSWCESFPAGLSSGGPAIPAKNRQQVLRFIRYELFGACVDFMNEGMPPEAVEDAKELLRLSLKLLVPDTGPKDEGQS